MCAISGSYDSCKSKGKLCSVYLRDFWYSVHTTSDAWWWLGGHLTTAVLDEAPGDPRPLSWAHNFPNTLDTDTQRRKSKICRTV